MIVSSRAARRGAARPTTPEAAMNRLSTDPSTAPNPSLPQSPLAADVAASVDAERHFASLLAFETDCYDVHAALGHGAQGFVVLDVRAPTLYAAGHVPGAVNLPHGRIVERNLGAYPADVLFVVYCSGPHCNGADRAALRLARLGRPVKKMIGGIEGWKDEGLGLETGA
jgi:rhodanese-related sulfurtransferase